MRSADSEATVAEAAGHAERTVDEANQLRDAIRREIDELSVIREQLLQRLIELGGEVVGATERFRGYAPGSAPRATPTVALLRRGGRRRDRCRGRRSGDRQRLVNTIGKCSIERIAGV